MNFTLLVLGVQCPFASRKEPATFHVFVEPSTVTDEFVIVTAPEVKVALFCVAVPAPELASKVTVSVAPGVHVHAAPPEVVDHFEVSEKFPVPPIQKQFPPVHAAEASPVRRLKKLTTRRRNGARMYPTNSEGDGVRPPLNGGGTPADGSAVVSTKLSDHESVPPRRSTIVRRCTTFETGGPR